MTAALLKKRTSELRKTREILSKAYAEEISPNLYAVRLENARVREGNFFIVMFL